MRKVLLAALIAVPILYYFALIVGLGVPWLAVVGVWLLRCRTLGRRP